MRLLCDEMLGKLARWLRLLGLDVAYVQGVGDAELLRRAGEVGRLLLTRDAALAAQAPPGSALRVQALEPEAQLREVVRALALPVRPERILTRCSVCNTPLLPARAEEVQDRVPPAVRAAERAYWRCPGCGRAYWRGTHVERIEAALRDLAAEQERGP